MGLNCVGMVEPRAFAVTADTVIHSPVMSCRRTGSGSEAVLGDADHPGAVAERGAAGCDS